MAAPSSPDPPGARSPAARPAQQPGDRRPPARYANRRFLIVHADHPFGCPFGHHQDDGLAWDHGAFRCTHRGRGSEEDCNALFLFFGRSLQTAAGRPAVLLVHVLPHEMKVMKRERLCVDCNLAFLGVFPYRDPASPLEPHCVGCARLAAQPAAR